MAKDPAAGPADAMTASGSRPATFLGRRRVQVITAAAAVAVVAAAAIGIAVATSGNNNHSSGGYSHGGLRGHTIAKPLPPSATAVVAPGSLTQACTSKAGTFTFSGSITAHHAGAVAYQWVFSTGRVTPAQTLSFSSAGTQATGGQTLTAHASVHGWAKVQVIGPSSVSSKEAAYVLSCTEQRHGSPGIVVTPSPPTGLALTVGATAQVAPAKSTITCGGGRPAYVFSGSITTNEATPVSYHWALSNGTHTATRTLTFGAAGTRSVVSDSFTPPSDKFTGSAKIVVTSPIGTTSNTATFTLSCVNPELSVTLTSSPTSPASFTCGTTRPAFTITGAITASRATALTYHWVRSDGTTTGSQTVSIGAGQTGDVTDSWTPPADNFTGSDALDITAPISQTTSIPISLSCT
jgi:hypothetical protein